jgi:dihydrolipoamide dehydrogenase
LVVDAETNTLLGATFVGPQFSELAQAATLAIVAKLPVSLLRHAVAPHPTVNQVWDPLVWDPLLTHESELAPLLKNEAQKVQKGAQANRLIHQTR